MRIMQRELKTLRKNIKLSKEVEKIKIGLMYRRTMFPNEPLYLTDDKGCVIGKKSGKMY